MLFQKTTTPPVELSTEQKNRIRELLARNVNRTELADSFGCNINQINGIWSQMVQAERRKNGKKLIAAKKAAVSAPLPLPRPVVSSTLMARTNSRTVRIDASNFDEVILVNGENEINIQISS